MTSNCLHTLEIQATICEQYAKKFDVLFNGKKSLLIIYKCTRSQPPDLGIVINNVRVPKVDEVILLGHHMCEDIYKFNASKCVSDSNRQSNMFFANFKNANSYIRNVFFHKYCTSFYGSQLLPMFRDCMQELYTALRIAVHRVWLSPVVSLLDYIHTVYFSHIWLGVWILNYGFPEDVLGF